VFWDNTPCSVITIYPRFGRTWTINIPPKRGRIFLNRSNVKGNGNVHPITGHKGPEVEYRYTSTLSLTSALDWGWVVNATTRPLYPWERPGTHCIGGWVGPRGGLGGQKASPPP
jgi:hypothetical protein